MGHHTESHLEAVANAQHNKWKGVLNNASRVTMQKSIHEEKVSMQKEHICRYKSCTNREVMRIE